MALTPPLPTQAEIVYAVPIIVGGANTSDTALHPKQNEVREILLKLSRGVECSPLAVNTAADLAMLPTGTGDRTVALVADEGDVYVFDGNNWVSQTQANQIIVDLQSSSTQNTFLINQNANAITDNATDISQVQTNLDDFIATFAASINGGEGSIKIGDVRIQWFEFNANGQQIATFTYPIAFSGPNVVGLATSSSPNITGTLSNFTDTDARITLSTAAAVVWTIFLFGPA